MAKREDKKSRKWIWIIPAAIIVLLLIFIIFIPTILSTSAGESFVRNQINQSIDGQADFQNLSVGWIGGIEMTNFTFRDDTGTNITVERFSSNPSYTSLLTGRPRLGRTVVDRPVADIYVTQLDEPEPRQPMRMLPVESVDLIIQNGNVRLHSQTQSLSFADLNSEVLLRPAGQQSNFAVNMTVSNGTATPVQAQGNINPGRQWSLEGAEGQFSVEVSDLDMSSLGPLFELAGVSAQAQGRISADIDTSITDGRIERINAQITGRNIDYNDPNTIGRLQTSILDANIQIIGRRDAFEIQQLDIETDWLTASAAGVLPLNIETLSQILQPETAFDLSGNFNLDLATAMNQMPELFNLPETTQITSGRLTGNIQTTQQRGKTITADLRLEQLAGTVEDSEISLSQPVQMQVSLTEQEPDVLFGQASINAAFAEFQGSGEMGDFRYQGWIELADLQQELGQLIALDYQLAGRITSNGRLQISDDLVDLSGENIYNNITVSTAEASASEEQASVRYDMQIDRQRQIVDLETMNFSSSVLDANVTRATIPFGENADELDIALQIQRFDLAQTQPWAVLFAGLNEDMNIGGTGTASFELAGTDNEYQLNLSQMRIEDFLIGTPGEQPFTQQYIDIQAEAFVNPELKTYDINYNLESPDINSEGFLRQQQQQDDQLQLQGQSRVDYDWQNISRLASGFLPQELQITGTRSDSFEFVTTYPAQQPDRMFANLNASGQFGFENAEYMGFFLGPTDLSLAASQGLLQIEPFTTTVNEGQLDFAGNIDFNQDPFLFYIPENMLVLDNVQINEQTSANLLQYINPIFAGVVSARGLLNFRSGQVEIPLGDDMIQQMELDGVVSLTDVMLQASNILQLLTQAIGVSSNQMITVEPTRFAVQGGALRYDDMQLNLGNNPFNFRGRIGFDQQLDMTVVLPYTLEGRTARVGEPIANRIEVPLSGTIDSPEVNVGRMLEQQLQRELERQLRRGLEGIFR